jgi:transposase
VIDAILWKLRTGAPWQDLPERYGPWKTAHERLRRWTADGTWDRILDEEIVIDDSVEWVEWVFSVDSSAVRAHQHAAGARKRGIPNRFDREVVVDELHSLFGEVGGGLGPVVGHGSLPPGGDAVAVDGPVFVDCGPGRPRPAGRSRGRRGHSGPEGARRKHGPATCAALDRPTRRPW